MMNTIGKPAPNTAGKRLMAALVVAALVACAGTLMGASDRVFKMTSPANSARVQGPVVVRLLAKGFDDMAYVIFGVDQMRPHSSNSLPYRYTLNTTALSNGPHTLGAWGYTHYGLVATAPTLTIVVANPAEPQPAPAAPMLLAPPATASLAAPAGPQAQVQAQPAGAKSKAPKAQPAPAAPQAIAVTPPPAAATAVLPAQVMPAAAALAACAAPAAAVVATEKPGQLALTVDGAPLESPVAAEVRWGVAYGPLRGIVERIGGSLGWSHLEKRATAETTQVQLVLTVGSASARVNEKQVALAGPVWLQQGRTMAPVRSCAEALRMRVAWEPDRMVIALFTPAPSREVGMLPR
jgi:hypothetical protein